MFSGGGRELFAVTDYLFLRKHTVDRGVRGKVILGSSALLL
jgi:hypothetical protein